MKDCGYRNYFTLLVTLFFTNSCVAVTFNPVFLADKLAKSSLSRFSFDLNLPRGVQEMDMYVNQQYKGCFPLVLGKTKDTIKISQSHAAKLGINLNALKHERKQSPTYLLLDLVQGGSVVVDSATLRIDLTVPQKFLNNRPHDYIDPRYWQDGVPALKLSYSGNYYTAYQKQIRGYRTNALFLNVDLGMNLFGFQYRDNSTYHSQNTKKTKSKIICGIFLNH